MQRFLEENVGQAFSFVGCSAAAGCGCKLLDHPDLTCQCVEDGLSREDAIDFGCRLFVEPLLFDGLQVLGATPVRRFGSGAEKQWEPACEGGAEAVRFDLNLLTTQRRSNTDGQVDKDRQARPGDVVALARVEVGLRPALADFDLEPSCLSEHHGVDSPAACASAPPSSALETDGLVFVDHLQGLGRGTPIGVAILVDQSGSTSGLVDGTLDPVTQRPSCIEGKPESFDSPSGDTLARCASDKSNARLAQAKALIKSLNAEDRAIVFQFNENVDVKVVCDPGVDAPADEFLEANCFSTDRSFVLGDIAEGGSKLSVLDGPGALPGRGVGRSNLWRAVDKVFDYMTDPARAGPVARHIVIITDGPDTCSPGDTSFQQCFKNDEAGIDPAQQAGCGLDPATGKGVAFSDVRATVADYLATRRTNQLPNDVHISFLHFQSPGYAEHDSRMQQIACVTGGSYAFVNRNQIPEQDRHFAMDAAIQNIRMSLGGHWGLVSAIGALTADPSPNGVQKGQSYTLDGDLTLVGREGLFLEQQNTTAAFSFWDTTDQRLPILRPCEVDADCGVGAGAPCGMRCDPSSKLCEAPAQGSSCGEGSVCCAGACAEAAVCVDPADPFSCP